MTGVQTCALPISRAVYVFEKKMGYGHALISGLARATGEIIIMAEPDNSFVGADVLKLLVYSKEFDVVFGTRTSKALIRRKAKMGDFLRYGNVAVAKLLEYLYDGPCLTDVGCTMKLIKREHYIRIKNKLLIGGSHFSPHFMIVCITSGCKCIEVPLNYRERVGESKITSDFWKSFKLGMKMIFMIIRDRFKH